MRHNIGEDEEANIIEGDRDGETSKYMSYNKAPQIGGGKTSTNMRRKNLHIRTHT